MAKDKPVKAPAPSEAPGLPDVAADVAALGSVSNFVSAEQPPEPRNLTREFLAGIFGEEEARKRIP